MNSTLPHPQGAYITKTLCNKVILLHTVLLCFLAHVPISEHAAIFKYRRTDVNCNIYNIGTIAFLIISQHVIF